MINKTGIVVSGLMLLASTTIAVGDSDGVRIVTRYSGMDTGVMTYPVNTEATRVVRVVRRPVADRSAMVSREMYEQPVYGHLVEVRVDQQTIYLDPQVDYIRHHRVTRMQPNYLVAAVNEYRYQEGMKHRIVRRDVGMDQNAAVAGLSRIVIFRPGGQNDGPGMRMMPSVPNKPQSKDRDLMVTTQDEVLPRS